jgi:hypothetical protein
LVIAAHEYMLECPRELVDFTQHVNRLSGQRSVGMASFIS